MFLNKEPQRFHSHPEDEFQLLAWAMRRSQQQVVCWMVQMLSTIKVQRSALSTLSTNSVKTVTSRNRRTEFAVTKQATVCSWKNDTHTGSPPKKARSSEKIKEGTMVGTREVNPQHIKVAKMKTFTIKTSSKEKSTSHEIRNITLQCEEDLNEVKIRT